MDKYKEEWKTREEEKKRKETDDRWGGKKLNNEDVMENKRMESEKRVLKMEKTRKE